MMGQLPLDLDSLRRGVHQPVRRLIEHRPAAEAACSQYAVCKVTIFDCPAVDGAPVWKITRSADTWQGIEQCLQMLQRLLVIKGQALRDQIQIIRYHTKRDMQFDDSISVPQAHLNA